MKTTIKNVWYLILLGTLISCFTQNISASLEPLMKYPTQQELEEVEKLLSTLSPEELEELTKLGEELIKTAEQEGRPLFAPAPAGQPQLNPIAPKQEPTKPAPVKPTKEEARESSIPKKQLSILQKMLSDLVDTIGTIRQKAATDEKLLQVLDSINQKLNNLTYYLRTIAYSKQVSRLMDQEFVALKDLLQKLSVSVEALNDLFEVEDTSSKLASSRKSEQHNAQLQQAYSTLKKFVDVIEKACTQDKLLEQLESFMKKYEPEALELKKKQEAQEKEASAYTKKIPATNAGTVNPQLPTGPVADQQAQRGGSQGMTGVRYGQPLSSGGGNALSVKTAKPMQAGGKQAEGGSGQPGAAGQATKKAAADDKKDKDDKKKEELQDAPLSIDEQAMVIKQKLSGINSRVVGSKQRFDDFFTYLQASPDEASEVEQRRMYEPLGSLQYDVFKIKKSIEKWAETIGKTAEYREARAYQDSMQKFVDGSLNDFRGLVSRIDAVLSDPNKSNRVVSHEEELKELKKIARDISSIRIRPK